MSQNIRQDGRKSSELYRPSSQLYKRLRVYTAKPYDVVQNHKADPKSASHVAENQQKMKVVLPTSSLKKTEGSTGKKIPQKAKLHKSSSMAMLKKHNEIRSMTAKSNLFGVQSTNSQLYLPESNTSPYSKKTPLTKWSG